MLDYPNIHILRCEPKPQNTTLRVHRLLYKLSLHSYIRIVCTLLSVQKRKRFLGLVMLAIKCILSLSQVAWVISDRWEEAE